MQKINTCIALRFHAGNDLLDIFNKTSITLSADSKYTFLDKMGDLNTEGIVRSVQMGIGGKVTVDNIDGMTIARDLLEVINIIITLHLPITLIVQI